MDSVVKKLSSPNAGYGQDVSRTWEAVLLGAIPLVNYASGLKELFDHSPVLQLTSWDKGLSQEDLLNYRAPTRSRKVLMFQYWYDRIHCIRKNLIFQGKVAL